MFKIFKNGEPTGLYTHETEEKAMQIIHLMLINLNFEIIDALMRNDKFLAEMYIEEIIRSTTLSESYRKNTGR